MAERVYPVGVEINADGIRVCQLAEREGKPELLSFDVEPLPGQAGVEGVFPDREAVVAALGGVVRRRRLAGRLAALSVPLRSVFIKRLSLPIMDRAELAAKLSQEAGEHFPISREELLLSHEVTAHRPQVGEMDVLLVAARRTEIAQLTAIAAEAGLIPVRIVPDVLALQRACEKGHGASLGEGSVALVEVGANSSVLAILLDGAPIFVRNIEVGGKEIGPQPGQGGELAGEGEAREASGDGAEARQEARAAELAGELQRSFSFYLAVFGQSSISAVYLSGAASRYPELARAIGACSLAKVTPVEPLKELVSSSAGELAVALATVAVGLALGRGDATEIDLLPPATGPLAQGQSPSPLLDSPRFPSTNLLWLGSFAAMVAVGSSLAQALTRLATVTEDEPLRAASERILASVKEGASLAGALALYPDLFDPITLTVIRHGEVEGTLDRALDRLVQQARDLGRVGRKYRALAAFADLAEKAEPWRQAHRFCGLLGMLVESQNYLLTSLNLIATNLDPAWGAALRQAGGLVAQGERLARALDLALGPLGFPPAIAALVAVGEEVGALGTILFRGAALCEDRVVEWAQEAKSRR